MNDDTEANDQTVEKKEEESIEYIRGLQELLAQAAIDEKKRRQEANDQIAMSMGYL